MIRVVIVEDETLVRLGLRACLETDENIVVSAAFATAEEAESQMEHINADILLTDIRLPEKSGLDLMKVLKEKFPELLFVVLSCYEDFSYAQKAMEYGAVRYLLKHELDEQQLPQILTELTNERKHLVSSRSCGDGTDYSTYAQQLCSDRHMFKALYFHFVKIDRSSGEEASELNMGLMRCMVQEMLDAYELGRAFLYAGNELIALIKNDGVRDTAALLSEIQGRIKMYADIECFLGCSDESDTEIRPVDEYLRKAKARARYAFYYEHGCVLDRDRKSRTCPQLRFIKEDVWSGLWLANTIREIHQFVHLCRCMQPGPEEVLELAMKFIQDIIFYSENCFGIRQEDLFSETGKPSYTRICRIHSIKALESWLVDIVELMAKHIKDSWGLQYQIKMFLEQHYMEELSQTEVAAKFHMTAPYFSAFFKQTFGVNYITYLNRIRIEKAKILLVTSADSAEKIGILVGIANVNYFFRQFKRLEGCTINEYRKKYRACIKNAQF